jgi:hypothetical protein
MYDSECLFYCSKCNQVHKREPVPEPRKESWCFTCKQAIEKNMIHVHHEKEPECKPQKYDALNDKFVDDKPKKDMLAERLRDSSREHQQSISVGGIQYMSKEESKSVANSARQWMREKIESTGHEVLEPYKQALLKKIEEE